MATAADILGIDRTSNIPVRWAKHYQRLCDERDRLLARDCSAPKTSVTKTDDLGEAAAEESQRSLCLVAAGATKENIVEVLEAIRRIERGTYGFCEMTGEPIEAARLRAIPWTRYSLHGQNELEKGGLARKHALPLLQSVNKSDLVGDEEAETEEEAAENTM